jgi:hypothetical protein
MRGQEPSEAENAPAGKRKFRSPQEYAAITGLSLSTVHRRLKRNQIPKFQPGGPGSRVLIPVDEMPLLPPEKKCSASDTPPAAPQGSPTASVAEVPPRPRGPKPRWLR